MFGFMKIIDAHVHFSRIASFEDCAKRTSLVDYSERGYIDETGVNEVVHSVCMGLTEGKAAGFPDVDAKNPMLADLADNRLPLGMSLCLGINPHTLDGRGLAEMEELIIESGNVVGMKIYAGYYHVGVTDTVYDPVYKLAEKHDLAVAIHTGDTYSDRGLLKYAHPLCIDELAVTRPGLRIVACHMGTPWVFDACEVAGKNPNVYMDMSGLLTESPEYIKQASENPLILDRYRQALTFLDNYDKVLFGTDWPLVPMGAYIDFCKQLVPCDTYEKVFYITTVKSNYTIDIICKLLYNYYRIIAERDG
jgi:hypothetical protein